MDERFTALVRAHRVGLVGYLSRYVDVRTAKELAADTLLRCGSECRSYGRTICAPISMQPDAMPPATICAR